MKKFLLSFFIVCLTSFLSVPVFAASLEQLTSDYFFQLEKYREAEDEFNLRLAEYRQIDTLVSRETAISSLKQAMVTRSLVLESYLSALESILGSQEMVENTEKEAVLELITDSRDALGIHRESIPGLFETTQVNQKADEFLLIIDDVTQAQYMAYSLIAIAKIESVSTNLIQMGQEFQTKYIDTLDDKNVQSFANRGMKDVEDQNQKTLDSLALAKASYNQFYTEDLTRTTPQEIYNGVVRDLQPTLTSTNRSLSFLRELNRQVN